ncbi:hypothetical protein B0H11DRAFT_1268061 [Mycena galericulata]|nr:hypothetical protein B0H11DRAFT_1268061 [Mycena galericulata]
MDDCSETYRAVSGDTCAAIAGVFDLSAADFLRMNPTVGASCMNLQVGQEYCVQKGAEEEGENGDDDGDEDEDDGDEYGQYVYPTIVHVHNYPGIVPCMACHDQSSDSGQPGTNYTPPGVVPGPSQNGPVTPSAPSSPSNLTVPPTLPTDSPGLNSTNSPPISSIPTNSTDFNSTDSTPLPTLPNSNSTDFNATTTDPDTDSSDSNPDSASSLGDMPLNGTTVVSSMSQPAPSTTSPDTEDSDDILPASNSSDNSGMDSRASGSPRKVSVTWEEDF